MARVCAGDAYEHALRRHTFGKALIENQVIRAKFAKMARCIEPLHAYMENLVYTIEQQRHGAVDLNVGGMIATLKTGAGRTLEKVNREAQQVLGGAGYAKDGKGGRIEQISRDVRVMVVGGGSEEILSELAVKLEMKGLPEKRQTKL